MSESYFALTLLLSGFPLKKILFLLEKVSSFECLWKTSSDELVSLGLEAEEAKEFCHFKKKLKVDAFWTELEKKKISLVCLTDDLYPSLLKEIPLPPLILFYRGELKKNSKPQIAVVGSRLCSSRGKSLAKELSSELSRRGFTIISGLARGIDTCAHLGALEGEGGTIAVLGCGLDIDYPPENKSLNKKITEKGCVLTEFLPGTKPLAFNFPLRNRIIAGLSQAVIVVEARAKSGALITAHLAADYGRDVMAFPGNPENSYSRGCNQLIKEGAYLVENLNDVLDILGFPEEGGLKDSFFQLSKEEKKVVDFLQSGSKKIDEIIKFCGKEAVSLLTLLEIKGIVSRDHGQRFSLKHHLKNC